MKVLALLFGATLVVVHPGESRQNLDGVRLSVRAGAATIEPAIGTPWSPTRIHALPGSRATVLDLDANDSVVVDAGAKVCVGGQPRTVTIAAGAVVRVVNYQPLQPLGGGVGPGTLPMPITVLLPLGGQATIYPGTEWTFAP